MVNVFYNIDINYVTDFCDIKQVFLDCKCHYSKLPSPNDSHFHRVYFASKCNKAKGYPHVL